MGMENGVYHICDCQASKCKLRKARGDNRELVHIDRWRLLTPLGMIESPYLRDMGIQQGESLLANAARSKKAAAPRLGSGLDALLEGENLEEPGLGARNDEKRRDRSRSPKRPKPKESMGRFLASQAAKQLEAGTATKKKQKKTSGRDHKEKRRRDESSETSSGGRSESSSFQLTPARGG